MWSYLALLATVVFPSAGLALTTTSTRGWPLLCSENMMEVSRVRKHSETNERGHPLTDASCTKCHAQPKVGGFHASPKHAGHTSGCLGCHSAHAQGDEAFGFIYLD